MHWLYLSRCCLRVQFLATDAQEWCYARWLTYKRRRLLG